jgi:F420-non-reducing hydrogenase iron-sulfur subunit
MCTGRVDLSFLVRAFSRGADGVIVAGCWPGECHYVTEGNYDALCNVKLGKLLLERIGVAPERLRVEWVGASEGTRYAEIMTEFSKEMKTLGPWRHGSGDEQSEAERGVDRLVELIPYVKLVQREKLQPPKREVEKINAFFASEETSAKV